MNAAGVWTQPVTISAESDFEPSFAVNQVGDATVAWTDGEHSVQAAYRSAGGAWTPPAVVSASEAEHLRFPTVAIGEEGDAAITWTSQSNAGAVSIEAVSQAPGEPWTAPDTVASGAGESGPLATTDPPSRSQTTTSRRWPGELAPGSIPAPGKAPNPGPPRPS